MYVSFDDGDHWQSLQLNLPNTSYRDAVITGNDLVVGTYGRGIWILDDISPLRQMTPAIAAEDVHLFKPGNAVRVHRNVGQDTPFPPEVPHALNPPDGAIIYYYLKSKPAGDVTLEVLDASGAVVRHLSSVPVPPVPETAHPPEPSFWLATPQPLPTDAGINRMNWDVRYDSPPAFSHTFEINANPGLTPASPEGPMAPPGTYTVRLTVDGKSYSTTVTVTNDPRSPGSAAGDRGAACACRCGSWQACGRRGMDRSRRPACAPRWRRTPARASPPTSWMRPRPWKPASTRSPATRERAGGAFRRGGPTPPPTFVAVNGNLGRQLNGQDLADMAPTAAMLADYAGGLPGPQDGGEQLAGHPGARLDAFNAVLAKHGMAAITANGEALAVPTCGGTVARHH